MATDFTEYRPDLRFSWQPRTLWVLIGVNTTIWLLITLIEVGAVAAGRREPDFSFLFVPDSWSALLREPWTPLTYMFTHVRFLHLLFNMLWLWWFGMELAGRGHRLPLVLYLGGGLAGAIGYLSYATLSGAAAPGLCGASASVLALTASTAILEGDRKVRFLFGWVRLVWICLGALLLTLISSLDPGAGAAHAGGILMGACTALYLKYFRAGNVKKDRKVKPRKMRQSWADDELPLAGRHNDAAEAETDPEERLDALLDKIRVSGYSSLSRSERLELDRLSARIGK